MKRFILALALSLAAVPVSAQQPPPVAIYPPLIAGVTPPIFGGVSSGVTGGGTVIAPQLLAPDGSASAPSYSFASSPTSGWFLTNTTNPTVSVGGTNTARFGSGGLIFNGAKALEFEATPLAGADVSLSRGAANRLDLATGDSLFVVSGGVGVGAAPVANNVLLAASYALSWSGQGGVSSSANAVFNWTNAAGTAGVGVDVSSDGKWTFATRSGGSAPTELGSTQTTDPTCTSNCGTSPTVVGTDSEFTVTMGSSGVPASGFVITFNGTWPANPQCVGAMAKTGMAIGKLPMVIVTTGTTMTVTTNGTAPATTDVYNFICRSGR